jgi:CRISPR-associated endoribonuclease Cas6
MHGISLYSLILELTATATVAVPALRGDHTHALFLDLVRQIDPDLSRRLHGEPDYRPFTVSLLTGAVTRNSLLQLQAGQPYCLRVTLLDGGPLWQRLSTHFLETTQITVRLDKAVLQLARVLSTPTADPSGWAGYTDWQTLSQRPAQMQPTRNHGERLLTLRFASPCAFSLSNRRFGLFPEPGLVWDSLMRTWNRYAPEVLRIEKEALRAFVSQHVTVNDYHLHTAKVVFSQYGQKGFQGTCNYLVRAVNDQASQVIALAEFARYAGLGSKTTMGMGQVRLECPPDPRENHR